MPSPVLGTRLHAKSGIGYQILCFFLSDPVLGTRLQSVFIFTGSGTGYQILLSILFNGSVVRCQILCFIFLLRTVLGTGLYARSGTGYQILFFLNIGSGSRYQISSSIYLYQIWCRVPGPLKYSFYQICCCVPDPVFYILY